MASQKYRIRGQLTTTWPAADLSALTVVAYRFIGPSTMQVFGKAEVDASGRFGLGFEYGTPGAPPAEVSIMPIPKEIERFGVFRIERSIPGLLFPRVVIAPGDWRASRRVYTHTASLAIPHHIWRRWDWLGEEFTVLGRLLKREEEAHLPIPYAWVWAADADLPMPFAGGVGGAQTDEWGNFTIEFRRIDFFINYAHYVPAHGRYGTEFWPDLVFSATQVFGGRKRQIYAEEPGDARPQAAWDVPHRTLFVTLVAEEGVTNDETYPPIPAGDNFLFHGIGIVDPHSLADGYATTGPADDLPNRVDCPFGGRLHLKGQFDTTGATPPRYYQVLFAPWTGATAPAAGDFAPIANETWSASQFDAGTLDWTPLPIEPLHGVVAGERVYEIPDYTDITRNKKTRLIAWTTTRRDAGVPRYPDGKYDVLVRAWDAAGAPVALNAAHPDRNRLTVVLDNGRPRVVLQAIGGHDILRTDEMYPYTPVCPVFSKATTPTLRVRFEASDPEGHFRRFRLSFITGHNIHMDAYRKVYQGEVGGLERFSVALRHKGTGWVAPFPPFDDQPPGGFPSETFDWNVGHADVVPCAYQVRLQAWDRTINGYGYIHYAEDTMHFSIAP